MLKFSALQMLPTPLIAFGLFVLVILFYVFGHRVRKREIMKDPALSGDLGSISGTFLGLLGLLLAFTFSMANSRYDTRRELVVEEANNIGTAILRTDVYPDSVRLLLRKKFQNYLDARISFFEAGMDADKVVLFYLKADSIGKELWSIATDYAKIDNKTTLASQLIPGLNAMIDITTTRRAAGEAVIPDSIMYFLFILCMCSAFLLGYDVKTKIDWIVVTGYALMLSLTIFNIIDLDRPRSGLIDLDVPNQKIVELRSMFK